MCVWSSLSFFSGTRVPLCFFFVEFYSSSTSLFLPFPSFLRLFVLPLLSHYDHYRHHHCYELLLHHRPEVTLRGWRDVKIQELTNFFFLFVDCLFFLFSFSSSSGCASTLIKRLTGHKNQLLTYSSFSSTIIDGNDVKHIFLISLCSCLK